VEVEQFFQHVAVIDRVRHTCMVLSIVFSDAGRIKAFMVLRLQRHPSALRLQAAAEHDRHGVDLCSGEALSLQGGCQGVWADPQHHEPSVSAQPCVWASSRQQDQALQCRRGGEHHPEEPACRVFHCSSPLQAWVLCAGHWRRLGERVVGWLVWGCTWWRWRKTPSSFGR
jgi:hypothetical protein